MKFQNKIRLSIIISISIILLLPLIAMQFTNEVKWTINDFLIAGVLLFATGFAIDLILFKVKSKNKRILISIFVLVVSVLIWMELAVGIFGTAIAGS